MNNATRRWNSPLAPSALTLALLAGCASTGEDRNANDVNELVRHGRFEEAVVVASKRRDAAQADGKSVARADEQWRLASAALLLSQGRALSFEDRDVEALEKFDAAVALAPDVAQVVHWRDATRAKLTDQWVNKATEWHASESLPEAVDCYEKALAYTPLDSRATQGLARALLQLNYRRGMGEKYYQGGVEALGEFWLDQAVHHFNGTIKYEPQHARAESRRVDADRLRADNRVIVAEGFEYEGAYSAARNEYRIATLLAPDHEAALAGLARTRKEEQAAEKLREADRSIMHGRFDEAEALLDQGLALTEAQKEAFSVEHDRLETARLTVRYDAARAMESDHRFEEAVVAYGTLLENAKQGYFLDVIARRDTLQDFIAKAATLYAKALAAAAPAEQLALLRQVDVVYPEYLDVRERLKALEAQPTSPR